MERLGRSFELLPMAKNEKLVLIMKVNVCICVYVNLKEVISSAHASSRYDVPVYMHDERSGEVNRLSYFINSSLLSECTANEHKIGQSFVVTS